MHNQEIDFSFACNALFQLFSHATPQFSHLASIQAFWVIGCQRGGVCVNRKNVGLYYTYM